MPNSIIVEGNTTNEAIEKGLKQLKLSKDQVTIKVLENEEKRSFFSILTPRVVKVEITANENSYKQENVESGEKHIKEYEKYSKEIIEQAEKNAKNFLDEFLKYFEDAEYEINSSEDGLNINIHGKSAAILIGYRGETLYALKNILSAVASRNLKTKVRVILDVEGYMEKRIQTLENLANRIAKTVIKNRKPVTLEPMNAYERKIIHSKLQNSKKVKTTSIGEEPRRRVVISLK